MDNQTESRKVFEELCDQFWGWRLLDEMTCGDEEPRLRWDGADYTHRVTRALWRMFNASRAAIVVKLPTQEKYDDPISAHAAINDCAEALRSIGITVKE